MSACLGDMPMTIFGPFNPWCLIPLFQERDRILSQMRQNPTCELADELYSVEYSLGWKDVDID
jgi:hypothetical protein